VLAEGQDAALSLKRGTVGRNVRYFEPGQGSALSAGAHFGVDQQTMEARAYAVARRFKPLLVNTVVGFIGPEYLFNGKEIIRAGLEDHFCAKLLGLPMGCDVCYTNHAEGRPDDMDVLLTLLSAAGVALASRFPARRRDAELSEPVVPRHSLCRRRSVGDALLSSRIGCGG
jgi:ethanolamine ammonia-lyase large subunit